MSAIVLVRRGDGKFVQACALLDTCSTAHFVTSRFAQGLKLRIENLSVPVGAMNGMRTQSSGRIDILFKSRFSEFQRSLNFLIVPEILNSASSEAFDRNSVEIPHNIRLADPRFHIPRSIDLLIGSGATLSLLSVGQINLSCDNCDLYLQKTHLGWVIAGGRTNGRQNSVSCNLLQLRTQLSKFWEVEECPTLSVRTQKDLACEKHYVQNTKRGNNGRYTVKLPFKDVNLELRNSCSQALRRFHSLQRTFRSDPQRCIEYTKVMQEYIDLGHMSRVDEGRLDGYYLPHHAVIKTSSATTKLQVVFDASVKSDTGLSLNNVLMTGPTIQPKLFEHLLRFRSYQFVVIADIEKMYRQILVDPSDRKFQRIFWQEQGDIVVFEMNTVTFGISTAPFLAIRTLQQLADDEKDNYPLVSTIVKRDDFLTGANSLEQISQIRHQMTALLKSEGFNIRQWASNYESSNGNCTQRVFDSRDEDAERILRKTLGLAWDSRSDCFNYTVKPVESSDKITKRIILSEIAKIFAPLGLLGPMVLSLKVIIQDCWRTKIGWDETVPQDIYTKWKTFAEQLNLVYNLNLSRLIVLPHAVRIEIHGFCDASQLGYGACLYVRSIDREGRILVRLACAKSRVAPVKQVSIPRLELCVAVLLARLYTESKKGFDFPIHQLVFWSDSEIVLHWIRKPPQVLKVFEDNRVAEIQELSNDAEWRHVRSKDNMADPLSRGQTPFEFIQNRAWFEGLPWLQRPSNTWPKSRLKQISDLPGLRGTVCLLAQTDEIPFYKRFSSCFTLVNVVAYCLRFRRPGRSEPISLQITEWKEAERRIYFLIQQEQFKDIIRQLEKAGTARSTKIASLSPFIDVTGLLRVGGRLWNADIPHSQKHPVLLPSCHHVTDLIIREAHYRLNHAGIQSTLYYLRQRIWLLDGKNQVRKIVRRCNVCIRHRPVAVQSKMGDLPRARVEQAAIFDRVGVDFLGPISIKEKKFKNRVILKAYGCVFICMVTKAIHLEIVSDLSADGFLAAFRRFIGRRGIPSRVFSDNGTNFVGANNQLQELYKLLGSQEFHDQVDHHALRQGIEWHFNPPFCPHFGGMWKALSSRSNIISIE